MSCLVIVPVWLPSSHIDESAACCRNSDNNHVDFAVLSTNITRVCILNRSLSITPSQCRIHQKVIKHYFGHSFCTGGIIRKLKLQKFKSSVGVPVPEHNFQKVLICFAPVFSLRYCLLSRIFTWQQWQEHQPASATKRVIWTLLLPVHLEPDQSHWLESKRLSVFAKHHIVYKAFLTHLSWLIQRYWTQKRESEGAISPAYRSQSSALHFLEEFHLCDTRRHILFHLLLPATPHHMRWEVSFYMRLVAYAEWLTSHMFDRCRKEDYLSGKTQRRSWWKQIFDLVFDFWQQYNDRRRLKNGLSTHDITACHGG